MTLREFVHTTALLRVVDRAEIPLPRQVRTERARLERVQEHARKTAAAHHGEDPRDVISRIADEILEAADRGDVPTLDVFASVDAVERQRRAADLNLEVAREAQDRAWRRLGKTIAEQRDAIAGGLRKTLEETLGSVRAMGDDLRGLDLRYPETFAGNPSAGKAYQALAAATSRYSDVREAQRQLWLGEPPDDELFLIENIAEVWEAMGVGWRGHYQVKQKPWPEPGRIVRLRPLARDRRARELAARAEAVDPDGGGVPGGRGRARDEALAARRAWRDGRPIVTDEERTGDVGDPAADVNRRIREGARRRGRRRDSRIEERIPWTRPEPAPAPGPEPER
jgi:hypothetical protein